MGLEPVLDGELAELGAEDRQILNGAVSFTGNRETMYRTNLWLRTAQRILVRLVEFSAHTADDLYQGTQLVDWSDHLTPDSTLAVHVSLRQPTAGLRHSGFAALKIKDSVVDQLRRQFGRRPDVDIHDPSLRIDATVDDGHCVLYLDSSGDSLHERSYRQAATEAPMKETLAAGLVLLSGWNPGTPLIDPFCGSGTLLIEAALLSRGLAPGLLRKSFGFERWLGHDARLLERLLREARQQALPRTLAPLVGSDIDSAAVRAAQQNIAAAGLSADITVTRADVVRLPEIPPDSVILCNPPYGDRLSTPREVADLGRAFGLRLRQLRPADVWVFTAEPAFIKAMGGRPLQRFQLRNGPLRTELVRIQV